MNEYELKQERRRERLENAADRAREESDAHHRRSHDLVAGIPFGQPILVGHHSEGRHRRAVDRSWNELGKAVEADKRAKDLAYRAAAVGTGGVSSDDPDAVSKLRAELEGHIARRDMMKSMNKAYRDAAKRGLAGQPASDELVAELAAKHFLPAEKVRIAVTYRPAYSWQKGPFENYEFSNLGANIRRIEGRIADLERRAAQREEIAAKIEAADEAGAQRPNEKVIGDVKIVQNFDANRLQLFFPGKPSYDVRAKLKGAGFRWAPSEGAWQRHLSNGATYAAEQILNSLIGGVS